MARPMKYKTTEEFDSKVKSYIEECEETGKPFTITGLALHMEIHKDTLIEYGKMDLFSDSYKKAKSIAENHLVNNALTGTYNSTVSIFLLKNNHNYTDKQEIEHSGEMTQKNIEVKWE